MSVVQRRILLIAAAGSATVVRDACAAPPRLPPGTHRLSLEAPALGATPEPLPLHLHQPAGWTADSPVAFVLHGLQRDADRYLASWRTLAEQSGVMVVVPEFSRSKFPGAAFYNLGHVVDAQGSLQPRSSWTFGLIDEAFDQVRRATGATRTAFALYGHSAGAQFAHRYLLMADRSQASLLISANAGTYTMPDEAVAYPFGLRNSGLTPDDLRRAFARPVVILLGEADTDPRHPSLNNSAEAVGQGPHRFARGQRFFAEARRSAEALGAPFHWRLATVPGADHDDAKMGPAAMRLIQENAR